MKAFVTFLIATGYTVGAVVLPSRSALLQVGQQCTNPLIRREWRSLTIDERKNYINAVLCMMSKPSKHTKEFPLIKSRYEDILMLHVNATAGGHSGSGASSADSSSALFSRDGIHGTANFLAWHRYSLSVWEDALIAECGWQGGIPYWNWHLDTPEAGGSFLTSPLFDPVTGFGGNGKKSENMSVPSFLPKGIQLPKGMALPFLNLTGGGCITTGPFVNHTLRVGPLGKMAANNTRCLTRNFNTQIFNIGASKESITKVLSSKTYSGFQNAVEHVPLLPTNSTLEVLLAAGLSLLQSDFHAVGHGGVGGEMMDLYNSANDPIFYQHHAAIDYFWALWQEQDQQRLHEYSGVAKDGSRANLDPGAPMWMGVFAPDKKAIQVADTQNRDGKGILCFKYEGLPVEKYTL